MGSFLAYNSYYRRDKVENINDDDERRPESMSLEGPLTLWLGLVVLAALLQLVVVPLVSARGATSFNAYFDSFAKYVIYFPGMIVLPLITALWIGERASYLGKKKSFIAYKGIANALYAAIVYIVAIIIIYIIMTIEKTGVLATMNYINFATYIIIVPLAISIAVTPLFAVLSASRRS